MLPAPRAAWRHHVRPPPAGNRRCVARRGRSVRRYDVTEARSSITVSRDD